MMNTDLQYLVIPHYFDTLLGRTQGSAPWQLALAWISLISVIGVLLSPFLFTKYTGCRMRLRHGLLAMLFSLCLIYGIDYLFQPSVVWDPTLAPFLYHMLTRIGGAIAYMQQMPTIIIVLFGLPFSWVILKASSYLLLIIITISETDAFSERNDLYFDPFKFVFVRKKANADEITAVSIRRCFAYFVSSITVMLIMGLIFYGCSPVFGLLAKAPRWLTSIFYLVSAVGLFLLAAGVEKNEFRNLDWNLT